MATWYVRSLIARNGISPRQVPDGLVEVQRIVLATRRAFKVESMPKIIAEARRDHLPLLEAVVTALETISGTNMHALTREYIAASIRAPGSADSTTRGPNSAGEASGLSIVGGS